MKKKASFFRKFEGFFYLIPFLIPYLIFISAMILYAAGLSLTDYKIVGETSFVGFENYIRVFNDPVFWQSLKHTCLFVLLSTPIFMLLAYCLAELLQARMLKSKSIFRTFFYIPIVLPVSAVATIGLYMFQPYVGLINNLLKSFGLLGQDSEVMWLGKSLAWITVTILTAWWASGFNIILYLAGMQDIPESYYESAELDGASYMQKTWYITIPLLSRIHVTVLFFQLIASFKIFAQVYWMTKGGPGGTTRTYVQYLWEVGFNRFDFGGASAISIILLLIVFVVSGMQYTLSIRYAEH